MDRSDYYNRLILGILLGTTVLTFGVGGWVASLI